MQIEKVRIEDVKPYENNAKLHPQEQIEQIKQSILEFGNNDPIAIDKNGVIIEGHGRYIALQQLGYKEIEVIKLGHLTEEQRKAYTLIHNKLTMNSGFDLEILEQELAQIEDIDMGAYDFDLTPADIPDDEIQEDEYDPAPPLEPTTTRGQIWKLGGHRLMVGDSTNLEDVQKLMDGAQADMVVTDPPYNVDYTAKETFMMKYRPNARIDKGQQVGIDNDAMTDSEFKAFLVSAFTNMREALKPGGAFYIWFASREHVRFETALNEVGMEVRQNLIWNKNHFVFSRQDYQWKHEPCLYGWKDGAGHYFIDDRSQTTVIEDQQPDFSAMKKDEMRRLLEEIYSDKVSTTILNEKKPQKSDLHPTMKPVKLIARQIKNSSRPGEKVLDLFGGSGTTLITCEQLDRQCYMMEYDPKYADVIIDRWETLTGEKAVLLNG